MGLVGSRQPERRLRAEAPAAGLWVALPRAAEGRSRGGGGGAPGGHLESGRRFEESKAQVQNRNLSTVLARAGGTGRHCHTEPARQQSRLAHQAEETVQG